MIRFSFGRVGALKPATKKTKPKIKPEDKALVLYINKFKFGPSKIKIWSPKCPLKL